MSESRLDRIVRFIGERDGLRPFLAGGKVGPDYEACLAKACREVPGAHKAARYGEPDESLPKTAAEVRAAGHRGELQRDHERKFAERDGVYDELDVYYGRQRELMELLDLPPEKALARAKIELGSRKFDELSARAVVLSRRA